MEGGESILDALNEEDIFEDGDDDDVEMLDVEEGELVEDDGPRHDLDRTDDVGVNTTDAKPQSRNQKRRASKKGNKRKRSGPTGSPNITDVNRFVLDTCRRLKEKKSYMVYTAVGCLGVSALHDLVKEVDAVQACGGQMTEDGRRPRTGGGILWSIIKAREPKAFREIMKKTKEFEKQFKRPNIKRVSEPGKDGSPLNRTNESLNKAVSNVSDDELVISEAQNQKEKLNVEENRVPVHERLRVPVSYDDDLLGGDLKDDTA